MAIMTWARTPLLLVLLAAGGGAGCASGVGTSSSVSVTGSATAPSATPSDGAATSAGVTVASSTVVAGEARSANAALASVEFVAAALAGPGADAFLASGPAENPQRGAPYDPGAVSARLGDLAALSADSVVPSSTAYSGELGPACDDDAGLVCQVELAGTDGRPRTAVLVHWLDGGVSDFVIVPLTDQGVAGGIGQVLCTPGHTLVHGGHAVDRFDVAVCADEAGNLEYNGRERGTDSSINLAACARGEAWFEATNEGFTYVVDGTNAPARTTLKVINPEGRVRLDTDMTDVRLPPATDLVPC